MAQNGRAQTAVNQVAQQRQPWPADFLATQMADMKLRCTGNDGEIEAIFRALTLLKCNVCGQSGHAGPQCWFNAALYEECRRQG